MGDPTPTGVGGELASMALRVKGTLGIAQHHAFTGQPRMIPLPPCGNKRDRLACRIQAVSRLLRFRRATTHRCSVTAADQEIA
jgi:hypothetical protein